MSNWYKTHFNQKIFSSDKTAKIQSWCRKSCPPKKFVRRHFCSPKFLSAEIFSAEILSNKVQIYINRGPSNATEGVNEEQFVCKILDNHFHITMSAKKWKRLWWKGLSLFWIWYHRLLVIGRMLDIIFRQCVGCKILCGKNRLRISNRFADVFPHLQSDNGRRLRYHNYYRQCMRLWWTH